MDIYDRYIIANEKFQKSKNEKLYTATKEAEPLFDIMYELEKLDRTENQSYLLALIYYELGWKWECRKFVKSYISLNKADLYGKWKDLLEEAEGLFLDRKLIEFRDLREAKKRNISPQLLKNDFIFNEDEYYVRININPNFNDVILLNKKVLNNDVEFDAEKGSNITKFIEKVNSHFSWTNTFHKELIDYYNDGEIDLKVANLDPIKVNDEWYDGLRVENAVFHYNKAEELEGSYTIYDYYNWDFGFHIETLDNSIVDIYYNTDL